MAVSDWLVELVEETLKLVASIIKSKPSHLTSLTHIVQQALALTLRLSSVLEPRYSLVRWLLAVAAQVAEELPQRVWDKLDKCSLLPVLPASAPRAPGETSVQYYRCGGGVMVQGFGTYSNLGRGGWCVLWSMVLYYMRVEGGVVLLQQKSSGTLLHIYFIVVQERGGISFLIFNPSHNPF